MAKKRNPLEEVARDIPGVSKVIDVVEANDPLKKVEAPTLPPVTDVAAAKPLVADKFNESWKQTPVQAAVISGGPQEQFRQHQMNVANQLAQQASGQGPSVVQMQAKKAQEQGLAQNLALLASQRGGSNPDVGAGRRRGTIALGPGSGGWQGALRL